MKTTIRIAVAFNENRQWVVYAGGGPSNNPADSMLACEAMKALPMPSSWRPKSIHFREVVVDMPEETLPAVDGSPG